mgnify:CR=1 FL=1
MKRYSREAILKDKRFLKYQPDFLKAILVNILRLVRSLSLL